MAAGNASFANENALFAHGNAAFAGGMCLLRMETPLRGRSGGHTGAAPTISRVVPCPKVAGEQFAADILRCLSQENSSPHYKHECIVVANSLPLHKNEFIVVANSLPRHKHK